MNNNTPPNNSPTREFYDLMQSAFDHFNNSLFAGELPHCMLTAQRQNSVMGYFSPQRWSKKGGGEAHEIALNPAYFANHRVIDVLQTLVHEQCHLWQYVHGKHKSRSGYHNLEWAEKMLSVGLIPSHTGEPGGRQTGQSMSDYAPQNGPFVESSLSLLANGYQFNWIDTEPAITESCQPRPAVDSENWMSHSEAEDHASHLLIETDDNLSTLLYQPVANLIPQVKLQPDPVRMQKRLSKTRYQCPQCSNKVWGKPELNIKCGDCDCCYIDTNQAM